MFIVFSSSADSQLCFLCRNERYTKTSQPCKPFSTCIITFGTKHLSKDEWYVSDLIWNKFTSATHAWKAPESITILITIVWDNGLKTLLAAMALGKSLENTAHCLIRVYSARQKEREKEK